MAITILDQPHEATVLGQKLIIVASSTNSSEPGFRYKAVVNTDTELYLPPNPNNYLVFDFHKLFQLENALTISGTIVHALTIEEPEPEQFGTVAVNIDLYEAWLVDGELTDDPDTLGPVSIDEVFLWNGTFQPSDGYKPAMTRFILDGVTKNWLTDRQWNTHTNANVPVTPSTSRVFIPVREADFGVITMWQDEIIDNILVTIFQSNGMPTSAEQLVVDPFGHWPVYPANLNINVAGLPKPEDYPNWRYITVVARDASDVQKSVAYYLYNVAVYGEQDCKHDVVRIGWKNYAGGWDYFNFTKRNEHRIQTDRKRFQKVLGNYGETGGEESFTFTKQDSGLTELKPLVNKYLEVHSDWISENEFVFLESLIVSQQVHWIQDDGTFTPVLVENDDYLEARERNGKLKNLTLKFRLANPVWV